MNANEKAIAIASFLDSKKAEDVQVLHVEEHTALTSYFVLAHGNNAPQVKALADFAEDKMAELGFLTCRRERDTELVGRAWRVRSVEGAVEKGGCRIVKKVVYVFRIVKP